MPIGVSVKPRDSLFWRGVAVALLILEAMAISSLQFTVLPNIRAMREDVGCPTPLPWTLQSWAPPLVGAAILALVVRAILTARARARSPQLRWAVCFGFIGYATIAFWSLWTFVADCSGPYTYVPPERAPEVIVRDSRTR